MATVRTARQGSGNVLANASANATGSAIARRAGRRLGRLLLCALLVPAAASSLAASDPYRDQQWGLDAVHAGRDDARATRADAAPVVVAVIDSGLDYHHPDLAPERIWRNPDEQANGRDDDGNGYVDDLIGWNFYDGDNNPWDMAGHGTHVAGVIAATPGNGIGIAGAAGNAVIMPLKVLNFGGYGAARTVAEAIYYAVAQGARVINLSLGSRGESAVELAAIRYAVAQDVVVVVAAGNSREDVAGWGPAGYPGVLSVAGTDAAGEAATSSNFGVVTLAAPGQDILSLRARRSDLALLAADQKPASGFVGDRAQLVRASGTSFAAPFVSAAAALLRGQSPDLSAVEVVRMLENAARDTGAPGIDQRTGYGILDTSASLRADPEDFIVARIDRVEVVNGRGGPAARVIGTADANRLRDVRLEIGPGSDPDQWQAPVRARGAVVDGEIAVIPAVEFAGAPVWTLRLEVTHRRLGSREFRYELSVQ